MVNSVTSKLKTSPILLQPFNVDPLDSSPLVIFGTVVTMNDTILEDGAVYIRRGTIEAVQRRADAAPAAFENAVRLETGGIIYPGLIDLHNHLNYNVLPLWNPPEQYGDRYMWRSSPVYKRDISEPMTAIIKIKKLSAMVIRYVEAKLLVGGVTSAQGMSLTPGDKNFYRGMVRNLEATEDVRLPEIKTQLEDPFKLTDQDKAAMRDALDHGSKLFQHLAEGRDDQARQAFEDTRALGFLRSNYVGIHCLGLRGPDYAEFGGDGCKAVWSPLSNLLLYGATLDLPALLAARIPWGLGCDWSPSGTKNPFGEMKVAWLAARNANVNIPYSDLVKAITSRAADIAGWGQALGRIEAGFYADLLVLRTGRADLYENLVFANEADVELVVISGVPRYGSSSLMERSGIPSTKLESRIVAGRPRIFFFQHPESPLNDLTLGDAITKLEAEMADLLSVPTPSPAFLGVDGEELELELEMDLPPGTPIRTEKADGIAEILAAPPLPPLTSVPLDKLTVVDDPDFFDRLEAVAHAPAFLRNLRGFYSH